MRGTDISIAEVTHISTNGFWLLLDGEELLLPFAEFPWFRNATIGQVMRIERPTKDHLYWPSLDVDLSVRSIRSPTEFPHVSQAIDATRWSPESSTDRRMCETRPRRRAHDGRGRNRRGQQRMADLLRGEIRWAQLNPTRGNEQARLRPVPILSQDVFNARSGTVIAVALTSQPQGAGFPLTLQLSDAKLPKQSWVKISQIRTLAVERIGMRVGSASPEDMASVLEGLNEILGA